MTAAVFGAQLSSNVVEALVAFAVDCRKSFEPHTFDLDAAPVYDIASTNDPAGLFQPGQHTCHRGDVDAQTPRQPRRKTADPLA